MLSADQLDAEHFETVTVRVDQCRAEPVPGRYKADLSLTIHGRTVHRRGQVELAVASGTVTSRGTLRLAHSDFGMEPYSAFLGVVRNAEPLDFSWSLQAKLTPPKR
jgi:polyisoprenoid-binding protein YceI